LNKQLIAFFGLYIYLRESLLFYLPFYYLKSVNFWDCFFLILHFLGKFWVLSVDVVNVIRNKNEIWFYVTEKFYWNPVFDMYLLNGGYNFVYDYFYDYIFFSKRVFKTNGGLILFFEIIFKHLFNFIF